MLIFVMVNQTTTPSILKYMTFTLHSEYVERFHIIAKVKKWIGKNYNMR